MEDVQGGALFEETYQCLAASSLPPGTLRDTVEYGNKSSTIDSQLTFSRYASIGAGYLVKA